MNVLVVGAGTIGSRVALGCSIAGHRVVVTGRSGGSLRDAPQVIEHAFGELEQSGLVPQSATGWQGRLSFSDSLEPPADVDIAIEAIAEDLELKQSVFEKLQQRLCPQAILTSSTSGLAVDAIASRCTDPERIAVMHFANPAHLMPTVELVPGTRTSVATMDTLQEFVTGLGKRPIRLKRDIPGHLFNRIQFAMLREAMALLREGVATASDIDEVVKSGLALRLAEEGPFEKMDLAGLELVDAVASYLFPELDTSDQPVMLKDLLREGCRGAVNGQGFYAWDRQRIEEVLARRNAEVLRHLMRLSSRSS